MKNLKIVINTLLLILIIAVSTVVIFTGKKEINGRRFLIVKSGSMDPIIKTGSIIVIAKQKQYKIGDIVTYGSLLRKDTIITHRIVDSFKRNNHAYFVMKGDANKTKDSEPVPPSSIIGKYVFGIPYAGYIISFARSSIGSMVLIIIPSTIIVWEEIKNLRKALFTKKLVKATSIQKPDKKKEKKK